MDALATLVCITFGLPIAVLFAAGYLLQHRRTRAEALLGTSEAIMPAPHGGNGHAYVYTPGVRCWELKCCALARRDKCPAYNRTYLPCWLALKLANGGHIERACLDCLLFQPERIVEGVTPAAETAARTS
jgi:hypothetical protein